jgi:hypothetical protein
MEMNTRNQHYQKEMMELSIRQSRKYWAKKAEQQKLEREAKEKEQEVSSDDTTRMLA